MNWLWTIAIKKAGVFAVITLVSILSSPKVVNGLQWLSEKGFHININVDQSVAAVSISALLVFLRNYAKVKMGAKFL